MRIIHQRLPSEKLQPGGPTIYCYAVDLPELVPYWHFHEPMELTVVHRGRGMRMVGNHVGDFAERDLVMIGSNVVHGWTAAKPSQGNCLLSGVHFPRNLVARYLEWSSLERLFERASFGLFFPEPHTDLMEAIGSLSRIPVQRRLLLFFEILLELGKMPSEILASSANPEKISDQHEKVLKIMAYVIDNCDQDISPAEVAGVAGFNPSYFSRWFHSQVGQRYVDFLNASRIAKACVFLLGELPMSEVAHKSGFDSVRSFNRNFKKLKGKTPQQFRAESKFLAG